MVILAARAAVSRYPHQSCPLAIRFILMGHIDCVIAHIVADHRRIASVVIVAPVAVIIMTSFTHQDEEFNTYWKREPVISLFLDVDRGVANHAIVHLMIIMPVVAFLEKLHESHKFRHVQQLVSVRV